MEDPDMAVRGAICCTTQAETSYVHVFIYMIKDYLPPVCVHCGKIENVLDDTSPCISALYGQFSVVRPSYESYRC
jgi:hypothetical protein